MIPFFAEELGNINVLRGTISADPTCDVAKCLQVKDNVLLLKDKVVADLNSIDIAVSTQNLVVAQPNDQEPATEKNDLVSWEVKLSLLKPPASLRSQQNDVKEWWTSKLLLEQSHEKQMQCRHCAQELLDASIEYKIKDLPSEHWYELVECWICHETKPEEHQARMKPILARPDVLLVGTTYFLIHSDNIIQNSIQADTVVSQRLDVSINFLSDTPKKDFKKVDDTLDIIADRYKNPRLIPSVTFNSLWRERFILCKEFRFFRTNYYHWERGTLTKWIAVNCTRCQHVVGEGQYCMEDGKLQLLAVKLFKYGINLMPNPSEKPVFIDFLVSDFVNTAKIHATHRFLIQGRQNQRIYTLIWLFNWDTNIIHNNGFIEDKDHLLVKERVMKVIYLDCSNADNDKHVQNYIKLWSNDKSTDHLIYPDNHCQQLVNTLNQSTFILPPFMRKINHPAMIFTKNFSVGFIHRRSG